MKESNLSPLVSAIITTYNRSDLLPRAFSSVVRQTYSPIEILIIDDGSNDNTASLLMSLQQDHPMTVLTNSVNKGAPYSRNLGAAKASGEFLMFLDDDDEWHPDRVSELVANYRSEFAYISSLNKSVTHYGSIVYFRNKIIRISDILYANFSGHHPLIPKSHFDAIGGYDLALDSSQDWDLNIRLIDKFGPAKIVQKPLYIVHTDDSKPSISSKRIKLGKQLVFNKHLSKMNYFQKRYNQGLLLKKQQPMSLLQRLFYFPIGIPFVEYLNLIKTWYFKRGKTKVVNILVFTNGYGTMLKNLFGPMSELFDEIAKNGQTLHIITREELIDTDSVPTNENIILHPIKHSKGPAKYLTIFKMYREGGKIIRARNIDVIYSHILPFLGITAALLSFRYRLKFFHWLCGDGREQAKATPWASRTLNSLFFWLIHLQATKMITGCKWIAKEQAKPLGFNPDTKYAICPNSVNIGRFQHQNNNQRTAFANTDPVVIYSSRITYRKGFDIFLDSAIGLIENGFRLNVIICGGGNKEDITRLQSRISACSNPGRIIYAGNIASKGLPDYLLSSDIFCVPARYQGFSRAYIEALAAGLPVITTPAGCTPEIIVDGSNGILVQANVTEVTNAIKYLVEGRERRIQMSHEARRSSNRYSVQSVAKCYIDIFNGH